jgi:flagellin-like hook-associated protein FlgL
MRAEYILIAKSLIYALSCVNYILFTEEISKVVMPEDDDIIELTEVVKPGGARIDVPPAPAKNSGAAPAIGHAAGRDEKSDLLLSDLDALLEELGVADQPKAPVAPPAKAAPGFVQPGVSPPGAQQTEPKAALSSDADILDLVTALPDPGKKGTAPAAAAAPIAATVQTTPVQTARKPASPDLEKINAVIDGLQPPPAQPEQAAVPVAQGLPGGLPGAEKPASPASQTEQDIVSILEDVDAATAAPQAAPSPPEPPASRSAQENDGIDLNELDAMLDQVLSVAPKNKRDAPTAKTGAPASSPAPAASVAAPAASVASPAAKLSAPDDADVGTMLREAELKQNSPAASPAASAEIVKPDVRAMPPEAELKQKSPAASPAASAEIAKAEEEQPAGLPRQAEAMPQNMRITPKAKPALRAKITPLSNVQPSAPGGEQTALSRAQAEIRQLIKQVDDLRTENREFKNRITSLNSEILDLRDNIEKHAAKAAARVIREELMPVLSAELD